MSEDHHMVTIEKTRVNIWNIGGFIVAIVATAFGWGVTYSAMTNANADAVKQINSVRDDIKDIRTQLPVLNTLQSRQDRTTEIIADNKAAIKSTNDRLDKVVQSFTDKLDMIIDKTNKIEISVGVLAAQVGDAPKPRRTRLNFIK